MEECTIRLNVAMPIEEALKLSAAEGLKLFTTGMRKAGEGRYEAIAALTSLHRSEGWRKLGAASLDQLAYSVAGVSEHTLGDMLRVGRVLLENPELDLALRSGRISWCKARTLVSVITPKNAHDWIARAEKMTTNKLEHVVGRQREPYTVEHFVPMFQVPKPVFERYKRLAAKVRAIQGRKDLDDVECLEAIFEAAETAWGMQPKPPLSNNRHIPAAILRKLWERAHNRCEECGNIHALEADHIAPVSEEGTHELTNLRLLCARCHTALHSWQRREKHLGERGDDAPSSEVRESRPRWDGRTLKEGDSPYGGSNSRGQSSLDRHGTKGPSRRRTSFPGVGLPGLPRGRPCEST